MQSQTGYGNEEEIKKDKETNSCREGDERVQVTDSIC